MVPLAQRQRRPARREGDSILGHGRDDGHLLAILKRTTIAPGAKASAAPLPHRRGASQQMTPPEVHNMTAQQPLARFRAGQVSCAIWENEIDVGGTMKTVLKG